MKVLWLCNIMLPAVARKLNREASNKEGWLSGLADILLRRGEENGIRLYVAFPVQEGPVPDGLEVDSMVCYGFREDVAHAEKYEESLEPALKKIVNKVKPDIVHCFGTEYAHTLAMCRIFPRKGRILVGLQGLCSEIADAYYANLPGDVIRSVTLRDLLRQDSLRQQQEKFALRGNREREIVGLAGNLTGRTPWDRMQTGKWNPDARYYTMNETLRPEFYEGVWRETECIPHSIFLSQGDYPLKGLHYMILALPRILEKYPDAAVYVAGNSLVEHKTWKQKLKLSAYGKYLRKLLRDTGTEDKVIFLGKMSGEQMRDRYLKSSLFVCPSSVENSPNSLGEAMLLGMPCIAAAVGGIPGIFQGGEDGILYEGFAMPESGSREGSGELERISGNLARAVLGMWGNPEMREACCRNAALHARKTHDRDVNYQRLLEIYREMAGQEASIVFVSNYINHHQIPFCNAMNRLLKGNFTFVQTEPMEEERVRMGWHEAERPEYVRLFYQEEEDCRKLIADSDVVLFGGTDDESYIRERLKSGLPVIRISERLYKTGQWKAVSPRGLVKKYRDHTRYRNAPVYLLCAGGYVASDFHIIKSYPGKMFCWGYFPEKKRYNVEELLARKGYGKDRIPCLLWAGRMIHWKHPELAIQTAGYLKEKNLQFHMDIIGDGELRPRMQELAERLELGDCVTFLGYQSPEAVRGYMEKADIFLFTSDRQEGWGAVANEAMNSACVLIADHMIGAVPFLVKNGGNGLVYEDGKGEHLFSLTERVVKDRIYCRQLARKAYETIEKVWNAENAAGQLLKLTEGILGSGAGPEEAGKAAPALRPCAPAPALSERKTGKRILTLLR